MHNRQSDGNEGTVKDDESRTARLIETTTCRIQLKSLEGGLLFSIGFKKKKGYNGLTKK